MFGIKDTDIKFIKLTLSSFDTVYSASIFGSRAKGNFKNTSDIDIAVFGDKVDFNTICSLKFILEEESPFPYLVDVVDYNMLENLALKEHIDRVGIEIYRLKI
jgi:uncharacterized protein